MTTYTGTCSQCGFVIAADADKTVTCNCGEQFLLTIVQGSYSETGVCDSDCRFARGPRCVCQCGGDNHCAGYMDASIPSWVRVRDAKAHATKLARREAKFEKIRIFREKFAADIINRFPALIALKDSSWSSTDDYTISFLTDMEAALKAGHMTTRQAESADKALKRIERWEAAKLEREAEKQALQAAGVVVPTGRVTFSGEIVKAEWKDNQYGGGAIKATIKVDPGYLVWGSLPKAINVPAGGCAELKGHQITLTATVSPSDTPLFGFYKNPRLVEFKED